MSEQTLPTAWMWTWNGQIRGLRLDPDQALLHWHDNIECHCPDDGSAAEQTAAGYLRDGIPPGLGDLPDDVQAELETTLAALAPRGT